jgi:hypothetical protein
MLQLGFYLISRIYQGKCCDWLHASCHVTMKPHPELVMYSAPTADSQFLSEKGRATRGSTGSTHKQAQ